jgi:hypothetical protein
MDRLSRLTLFALITTVLVTPCYPSIIWNNGDPNQVDGQDISGFIAADDFTLNSPVTITGLSFYSSAASDPYSSQFGGIFGWGFLTNGNEQPGALLTSGYSNSPSIIDTGNQILGTEEYKVSLVISSVSLGPGTYWLALHANPFGSPANGQVYWDTSGSQSGAIPVATTDLTAVGGWAQGLAEPLDLAFELTGTQYTNEVTPEPWTLPICAIVVIGLVFWRVAMRSLPRAKSHIG